MNGVILAAGMGRRFQPEPLAHPKCLLEFGGKSLLARSIEGLMWAGAAGVTVVAGYRAEMIEREVNRLDARSRVDVRYNPKYEGGSAGSVLCAADVFENHATLMLDSDILYDRRILKRMVDSAAENAILADCATQTTEQEYWLTFDGVRLTGSYKGQRTEAAVGVYWGLHKFSAEAGGAFVRLARAAYQSDANAEYWHVASLLFQEIVFGYVDLDGLLYCEIDSRQDAAWASEHVYPQLAALQERN